jgi:hypothetical protein
MTIDEDGHQLFAEIGSRLLNVLSHINISSVVSKYKHLLKYRDAAGCYSVLID